MGTVEIIQGDKKMPDLEMLKKAYETAKEDWENYAQLLQEAQEKLKACTDSKSKVAAAQTKLKNLKGKRGKKAAVDAVRKANKDRKNKCNCKIQKCEKNKKGKKTCKITKCSLK